MAEARGKAAQDKLCKEKWMQKKIEKVVLLMQCSFPKLVYYLGNPLNLEFIKQILEHSRNSTEFLDQKLRKNGQRVMIGHIKRDCY